MEQTHEDIITDFPRTIEVIVEYSQDIRVIEYVKLNLLRYAPAESAKNLIFYILQGRGPDGNVYFKREHLGSSAKMKQYNKAKFDKDSDRILPLVWKEFKDDILKFISTLKISEESFLSGFKQGVLLEDNHHWINKYLAFATYRKFLMDNLGKCSIKYDFDEPDMPITKPENQKIIQRIELNIMSQHVPFSLNTDFNYYCDRCGTKENKKIYDVVSTKNSISCEGMITYTTANGEVKQKRCGATLSPDYENSQSVDAFYQEVNYEDKNGTRHGAQGVSFFPIKPGKYEAVVFVRNNGNRQPTFYIVDVKQPDSNTLKLPKQNKDENYLFSLQRCFDDYVEKQTGMRIHGLLPIKIAMIIQKLANILDERLLFNVMLVGDASTGKSMILKYYSFLLNHYYNLSTNGLSVSVPGLRGTKTTINLFGKDIKIVTIGHLGTYHTIHIDEAGENRELIQNLKSFLMEDNYSYDKAGTVGVSSKRTAHVNLSQNLDHNHLGQYRGAVRKAYRELNIVIDGEEKENWDENWDIFLPIQQYENPHLRKVIREKRLEFKQKQLFWIDGLDYALHERFPFYFYLVTHKQCPELNKVIRENDSRKVISENLEVVRNLYTDVIDNFFLSLSKYREGTESPEAFVKVDKIIEEYGFVFDTRVRSMYYRMLALSRIANKRKYYEEMDFDLIRWFLETTNTKIDIADTAKYEVKGPPNLSKAQKQLITEEESKPLQSLFGLPDGEFS